ncbi:MAG TPA: tetratricopeptide repeat protein [Methylomirabilota bacterium]|nr:tetratricopeptide repeat protein [Methylomirabilota bacterium]
MTCPHCGYDKNTDDATTCGRCQALLKKAVKPASPQDIEAWKQRGQGLVGRERHEEAIPWFDRVLRARPGDGEAWLFKGNALLQLGRFADALVCFDRCLEIDQKDTPAMVAKAVCLQNLGRAAEANAILTRGTAVANANKARDLAAKDQLDAALTHADQAVAADPGLAAAWYIRGVVLQRLKRHPEAVDSYTRALGLDPRLLGAWLSKGNALMALARLEEALACFDRAAEIDADNDRVWLNKGVVEQQLGRAQAAIASLRRFIELARPEHAKQVEQARRVIEDLSGAKPGPAGAAASRPAAPAVGPVTAAVLELATRLLAEGRVQEGLRHLDRVLAADPGNVPARVNKGIALSGLGRLDEALAVLDEAIQLGPGLAGAWFARGDCLQAAGRPQEALACYDKAVELEPAISVFWNNRAACLNALGRREDAVQSCERAIAADPANVVAWLNKARTEDALGRVREAAASLRRFVELAPPELGDAVAQARQRLRELEAAPAAEAPAGARDMTAPPPGAVTPPAAPAPIPGTPYRKGDLIGQDYQVHGILGKGGFGVVYLVYSLGAHEVYALKTFRDEYLADAETRALFRREARVWIDLDRHPYLVRAYLVDEIGQRLFIVTQYVAPGEDGLNSLSGYLKRRPPDLVQSLTWAIQFCHGMEYAGSRGVRCHRDIKPDNILIDAQKSVKISDFGLAGVIAARQGRDVTLHVHGDTVGLSAQTMEGKGAGTPTHMPPEQFTDAAACDERSDVYAFGVVLYQMASGGRLPFVAPLPTTADAAGRFWAAMHRLHREAPVPPLDSPLFPIIRRCLEKEPARRYPGFAALRAELEALLAQRGGAAVRPPATAELDAREWIDKGISLAHLDRFEDAVGCFDRALALDPGSDVAWNNKGNALGRLGRREEALAAYDRALALDPQNPRAWRNKGMCLGDLGRLDEALQCLDRGLELDPSSALGWNNRGRCLHRLGRLEEALAAFDRADGLDSELPVSRRNRGDTLVALRRPAEALEAYEQATRLDPLDVEAWSRQGSCLSQLGRHEAALACLVKAAELAPDRAMVHNNVGHALNQARRFEEALPSLDRALELDPRLVLTWRNKAVALRELGRRDDALACLENALAIDPNDSACWYFKGMTLKDLGRFAEAVPALERMLALETRNTRALAMGWFHRGECLERQSQPDDALRSYEQALGIDPAYADAARAAERCRRPRPPAAPSPSEPVPPAAARPAPSPVARPIPPPVQEVADRGLRLARQGQFERALVALDHALGQAPWFGRAWNDKGGCLMAMGRLEEAINCFDRVLELEPACHGLALDNKAQCLEARDRLEEALACYGRAVELLPGNATAWYRKGIVEEKLGHGAEAIGSFQRFLAVAPPELAKEIADARTRVG